MVYPRENWGNESSQFRPSETFRSNQYRSNQGYTSRSSNYNQYRGDGGDRHRGQPEGRSRSQWRKCHTRSRSRCSSSSSRERSERKVAKAKELLLRKDPEYAKYIESEAKRAESERVREQGRVLAEALAPALGAVLGVNQQPPQASRPQELPNGAPQEKPDLTVQKATVWHPSVVKRLEAELSHTTAFVNINSWEELSSELEVQIKNRITITAINKFLGRNNSDFDKKASPRAKVKEVIAILRKP